VSLSETSRSARLKHISHGESLTRYTERRLNDSAAHAARRIYSCADYGRHDLVMRRSTDDGAHWEPLRTILEPSTLGGCNTTEACLPYTSACQGTPGTPGNPSGKNATVWAVDGRSKNN
jgi:hypothetical protein